MILPALTPEQIQAMGDTTRWHTRFTLRNQNLLEHSAAVALLAQFLAGSSLDDMEKADMLHLALIHDSHEPKFGDIPWPAKREFEKDGIDLDAHCRRKFWGERDPYLQVSDHVLDLIEVADVLEAALWAQKNAPEIADEVMDQAGAEARRRLEGAPLARAFQALGIWEAESAVFV